MFAGTTVIDGDGQALVIAVGPQSELGRVAELSAAADEQRTPLQREMDDLARTLAYVAIAVSLLIPALGFLRGFSLQEMVLTCMAALAMAILGVYFASLELGYDLTSARTAAWATWTLGHILLAINLKQEHTPLLRQGLLSNRCLPLFARSAPESWTSGLWHLVLTYWPEYNADHSVVPGGIP